MAQTDLEWEKQSLREFFSIAIHDLREPIRAIRAGSEMLAAVCGADSNEKAARNLRFVNDGADRLELLIKNLSDFCGEELREFDIARVPLDRALLDAQNQISGELSGADATVTYDPLPVVEGDFLALCAVLRHLIDNARKFRGEAAPKIHVAAEREPDASHWIISVRDNGMGISPQYRDQIFRPFERLNGRKYPGSGLGLTLAKRIVERHGGRIWADGTPDEGSVFSFTLPAER